MRLEKQGGLLVFNNVPFFVEEMSMKKLLVVFLATIAFWLQTAVAEEQVVATVTELEKPQSVVWTTPPAQADNATLVNLAKEQSLPDLGEAKKQDILPSWAWKGLAFLAAGWVAKEVFSGNSGGAVATNSNPSPPTSPAGTPPLGNPPPP